MTLNDTPRGMRLHIGIFGKQNCGKSTFINALTNQNLAIVSEQAGTTTDPVYKSMEINKIGPVVFIDTAGFDDSGYLGEKRIAKTELTLKKTDIALLLFANEPNGEEEWIEKFKLLNVPIIPIINKSDILKNTKEIAVKIKNLTGKSPVIVSAKNKTGLEEVKKRILEETPDSFLELSLTGNLAKKGDLILLVMPQNIQAPKNRLILPQVQTIRELLDKKSLIMSCSIEELRNAIKSLAEPPKLIITDSQVFSEVWKHKPANSMITSFSILMARLKGDIKEFIKGAAAIERLDESSHVLIAEACTHAPLSEDIGREQIPAMLRKKIGSGLKISVVSGNDFPADLSPYKLIVHCGACMFNRKYVLSRIRQAREQNTAITNYGVIMAYLNRILEKTAIPE